jgi:hypothetical protein
VLTGKLFEYLWSGTQIWGVGVESSSDTGEIITASKTGRCFGNDVSAISDALRELLRAAHRPKIQAAMDVIERYVRRSLAMRMLEIVASCTPEVSGNLH